MVEQVDVYVENSLEDDISVWKEYSDGTREPSITVQRGDVDRFVLPELEVSLIISPPSSVNVESCPFNVTENEHLVSWEAVKDHWTIKLRTNDADPEVVTAVYVTVGPLHAPT